MDSEGSTLRCTTLETESKAMLYDIIVEEIEDITGIDPADIRPESSFIEDLGIDSMQLVELAVSLEDRAGLKIPDEDISGIRTVNGAVSYLDRVFDLVAGSLDDKLQMIRWMSEHRIDRSVGL